ncbi:MAG: hypothetical protein ACLQVX_21990 [Limisphaerales bacterium]
MKTTKAVFGIVSITTALVALPTGCSRIENAGLKEYNFDGLANAYNKFAKGLPGFYSDYATHTDDTNFTLPDKAIYCDNFWVSKFVTDGIYNPEKINGEVPYIVQWLTELYWDVHFIGTAQAWDVQPVRGVEQKTEMISMRYRAKDKKTPTEIQVFEALSSILHKEVKEITSDSIDKQVNATLAKQFGEPLINTFIAKLSHSRKVVSVSLRDAATQYVNKRTEIAARNVSNGSESISSPSTPHKSARQLITDYAKSRHGRNATVLIDSGFAGGAYQVTVKAPIKSGLYAGGYDSSSYTVTVNERAQEITSWKLYDHN